MSAEWARAALRSPSARPTLGAECSARTALIALRNEPSTTVSCVVAATAVVAPEKVVASATRESAAARAALFRFVLERLGIPARSGAGPEECETEREQQPEREARERQLLQNAAAAELARRAERAGAPRLRVRPERAARERCGPTRGVGRERRRRDAEDARAAGAVRCRRRRARSRTAGRRSGAADRRRRRRAGSR